MILSDREAWTARARGAIRITPEPVPAAWSSAAVDLTLGGPLSYWEVPNGRRRGSTYLINPVEKPESSLPPRRRTARDGRKKGKKEKTGLREGWERGASRCARGVPLYHVSGTVARALHSNGCGRKTPLLCHPSHPDTAAWWQPILRAFHPRAPARPGGFRQTDLSP
jgi:hypothetical protein